MIKEIEILQPSWDSAWACFKLEHPDPCHGLSLQNSCPLLWGWLPPNPSGEGFFSLGSWKNMRQSAGGIQQNWKFEYSGYILWHQIRICNHKSLKFSRYILAVFDAPSNLGNWMVCRVSQVTSPSAPHWGSLTGWFSTASTSGDPKDGEPGRWLGAAWCHSHNKVRLGGSLRYRV